LIVEICNPRHYRLKNNVKNGACNFSTSNNF